MPDRIINLGDVPRMGEHSSEMHRQMLRALLRMGVRAKKAIMSGRISIAEYGGFVADMGITVEAMRLLNATPEELASLSRLDVEGLHSEAVAILAELGVSMNQEEVVTKGFDFMRAATAFLGAISVESTA